MSITVPVFEVTFMAILLALTNAEVHRPLQQVLGRAVGLSSNHVLLCFTGAGMSRGNKGGNSNSGGRRTAQDFIDDMKRLDGDKQYGSSKSEDHSGMASHFLILHIKITFRVVECILLLLTTILLLLYNYDFLTFR